MSDKVVSNDTIAQTITDSVKAIGKWIKDHTKGNGSIKSKPFENSAKELQQYLDSIDENTSTLQEKLEDAQETIVKDIITISSLENDLAHANNTICQLQQSQEELTKTTQNSSILDRNGVIINIGDTMTTDGCHTHVVQAIGVAGYFSDEALWYRADQVEHASDSIPALITQLQKLITEVQNSESNDILPSIFKIIGISNQLQRLADEELESEEDEEVTPDERTNSESYCA